MSAKINKLNLSVKLTITLLCAIPYNPALSSKIDPLKILEQCKSKVNLRLYHRKSRARSRLTHVGLDLDLDLE